mmetsp:Transcript_18291/g.36676  ORF Transcript_18291/g.36676 Transcript_18291/m.36676 type:complete len:560 (-) Transcript_18291:226-1905(-)
MVRPEWLCGWEWYDLRMLRGVPHRSVLRNERGFGRERSLLRRRRRRIGGERVRGGGLRGEEGEGGGVRGVCGGVFVARGGKRRGRRVFDGGEERGRRGRCGQWDGGRWCGRWGGRWTRRCARRYTRKRPRRWPGKLTRRWPGKPTLRRMHRRRRLPSHHPLSHPHRNRFHQSGSLRVLRRFHRGSLRRVRRRGELSHRSLRRRRLRGIGGGLRRRGGGVRVGGRRRGRGWKRRRRRQFDRRHHHHHLYRDGDGISRRNDHGIPRRHDHFHRDCQHRDCHHHRHRPHRGMHRRRRMLPLPAIPLPPLFVQPHHRRPRRFQPPRPVPLSVPRPLGKPPGAGRLSRRGGRTERLSEDSMQLNGRNAGVQYIHERGGGHFDGRDVGVRGRLRGVLSSEGRGRGRRECDGGSVRHEGIAQRHRDHFHNDGGGCYDDDDRNGRDDRDHCHGICLCRHRRHHQRHRRTHALPPMHRRSRLPTRHAHRNAHHLQFHRRRRSLLLLRLLLPPSLRRMRRRRTKGMLPISMRRRRDGPGDRRVPRIGGLLRRGGGRLRFEKGGRSRRRQ